MKAIVGLGNPGSQYESTRHNLGYLVVQRLAELLGVRLKPSQCCRGLEAEAEIKGEKVLLMLPLTFMNMSGKAVRPFVTKHDITVDDLLVVYDDFSLDFGQLRIRSKGSSGGHNGLSSIIDSLGSQDFPRLRVGIGQSGGKEEAADFVLSEFSKEEKEELGFFIEHAAACCRSWVIEEIDLVMSQFNKRKEDG